MTSEERKEVQRVKRRLLKERREMMFSLVKELHQLQEERGQSFWSKMQTRLNYLTDAHAEYQEIQELV